MRVFIYPRPGVLTRYSAPGLRVSKRHDGIMENQSILLNTGSNK